MRTKLFAMFVAATLGTLAVAGHARTGPGAASPRASTPTMPLSDVRPGQIGKIRTVFQGTAVEEFECEVIGILHNSIGPHKDMIMVKLRGEKAEFTGVVAGMSGSPVYIDGKLVGALAYRWGEFTKEPIAGITPIDDMLEVASFEQPEKRRSSVDKRAGDPARDLSDWLASDFWKEAQNSSAPAAAANAPTMVPIATPLVFGGFDRRLFDQFAGYFKQSNFVPVMGGGMSRETRQDSVFEPGAAVACVLMKGDMSIAGTGTLTYRDGDRVLGFGHPMFQAGSTDIPMAKANIVLTLSSMAGSFKIAEPTEIVGSIKQDRLTAIMGRVGSPAKMIPVSVEVHTARGETKSYNFEMFEESLLTPLLLNIALNNTMRGTTDSESAQTLTLKGQMDIEGHPAVSIAEVLASDEMDLARPLAFRASGYVTRLFTSLFNNGIERPIITKIALRIDQAAERRGATIEEVRADRDEVKPGEEFTVAVIIRPFRSERITKVVKLRAPETAERGQEMRVTISDAASFDAAEGRFGRIGAEPGSLDELITQLNNSRPSNAIYFRIAQSSPGAFINQQALPSLPLSILSVIGSTQTAANVTTAGDSALLTRAEPAEYAVSGRKTVRLAVK